MQNRRRLTFAAFLVLATGIAIEIILHCCCSFCPRVAAILAPPYNISPTVPDVQLGHRPNPAYPGHDKNGFRNPHVPNAADIVALGDSQTYGVGVEAQDAWPRQLELLTRSSVYSMAFGAWGPTHSLLLWDEAIRMKPAVVLEAFYAGNDLYDAFHHVWNKGQLRSLMTDDTNRIGVIVRMEEAEPIAKRVSKMYLMGAQPSVQEDSANSRSPSDGHPSIKSWFCKHSCIYGLLRHAKDRLISSCRSYASQNDPTAWSRAMAFAAAHAQYCQVFTDRRCRTIFTSEYRLAALNLDDPRVREGQRISLEAIKEMRRRADRHGVRFIVVLLPTKELVFSKMAAALPSPSYEQLVRNELQFWGETKAFLAEHSIEYIDTLEPLQTQLATGDQPYPVTQDGHPNASGHRAIARAIFQYLSEDPIGTGKQFFTVSGGPT